MTLPSSGPLSLANIQTEFGGSNPIGMNEYYAGGGLVPAGTTGTYGAVPSSGTISVQNFYGTSNYVPVYIEELFSTYLYTGNGGTKTITNDINLSANGGLTWIKCRSNGFDHALFDTARGVGYGLRSNTTSGNVNFGTDGLSAFNSNGFTVKDNGVGIDVNFTGGLFTSWTFRKQPKFFDVVTWTGNGVSGRAISHNLGSAPGCVIIKRTDSADDWQVWHRSLPANPGAGLYLNTTSAELATYRIYPNPDSTNLYVSSGASVNASGGTYVAYLFAHNAGGFGLTGTDNVISCGSFSGSSTSVTLGYEPQYVLVKKTSGAEDWYVFDTMRGFNQSQDIILIPNTSSAESNIGGGGYLFTPNATGFNWSSNFFQSGATYIYIAVRKGPMKVPTDATKVFAQNNSYSVTTNFPADLYFNPFPAGNSYNVVTGDRLRGGVNFLSTSQQTAELQLGTPTNFASNTEIQATFGGGIIHAFRRAPGFFDEVCYKGNSTAGATQAHNLGVVPEMMIVKVRSTTNYWTVYTATTGNNKDLFLNTNDAALSDDAWNYTTPTSSVFTLGAGSLINNANYVYVAYLFATCAGVSKVGSYTGTGTLTTINCGFSGGARFVMIKRSDAAGNWFVWNTATGMVAGTDYSMTWNTTNATTNANSVYTITTGFQLLASPSADVNTNGGTYIYLAIA